MLNKDCVWILSATSFVKLDGLINLEGVCVSDAKTIMKMGAADLINIKLMKCGGLYNALKIASAAEVYGVE